MKNIGFFQFEITINVLVSSFRLIWIPMLWVCGHQKYFNSLSVGIFLIRHNLTSTDVRLWRIKTVPALKGLITPRNIEWEHIERRAHKKALYSLDASLNMICKRCSLECDMGKYSTRPMCKVWAFRRTPCTLDECCVSFHCAKNEQRLYFLRGSSHTWLQLLYIAVQAMYTRVRYMLIPIYVS